MTCVLLSRLLDCGKDGAAAEVEQGLLAKGAGVQLDGGVEEKGKNQSRQSQALWEVYTKLKIREDEKYDRCSGHRV